MVEPRPPAPTVKFVDEYCQLYQNLFPEVIPFLCEAAPNPFNFFLCVQLLRDAARMRPSPKGRR
nr:hypothetical protein [Nostoc sp. EfeVER01]